MGQILQTMLLGPLLSLGTGQHLVFMAAAKASAPNLDQLGTYLTAGQIRRVVDRCQPLAEAAAAVRSVAGGHAQGKVVLTVAT